MPFSEIVGASVVKQKLVNMDIKLQAQIEMGLLRVIKLFEMILDDKVLNEIIQVCPKLKEPGISTCFGFSEVSSSALEKIKLDTETIVLEEEIMSKE